jgi:hypothetical protein
MKMSVMAAGGISKALINDAISWYGGTGENSVWQRGGGKRAAAAAAAAKIKAAAAAGIF